MVTSATFGIPSIPAGRSPGLMEHITVGDATDTAWYINSSGGLYNLDPGMMGEGYSITNVRYSYGKFVSAPI